MCDSDTEASDPPGLVVRCHRVLPAAQVLRWLFCCIRLAHVYCFVCLSSCPSVVSIVRLLPFLFFDGPNFFLTLYIYCSVLLCLILFSGIFYQALSLYPSLPFVPCPPPLCLSLLSHPSLSFYPSFPFFSRPPLPLSQASLLSQVPPPHPSRPFSPRPPPSLYPRLPFVPSPLPPLVFQLSLLS